MVTEQRHLVGDHHRHRGADQRPAQRQRDQHGELRRHHQHAGASATLTLTVNDNGNTGSGGSLVSVDTATITITAVNDAPVATITPVSYAATEQVRVSLKNNGLAISDADAGSSR